MEQHTEILTLTFSWITLSISWSFFPVRILIVTILHKWKFLFLIKLVDLKIIWPESKCMCGQYLTPRQMCSSTCSSKMDLFSSPGWRISSKSSMTSFSFILFFFCFLKIFTYCFYVVLNDVICWISVKKSILQVQYIGRQKRTQICFCEILAEFNLKHYFNNLSRCSMKLFK